MIWRAFETDNGPNGFSWELLEGSAWRASLPARGDGVGGRGEVVRWARAHGWAAGDPDLEVHTYAQWERTCGALEPACGGRCDGTSSCEGGGSDA